MKEIIFVEDDDSLREATSQALQLEGFNVSAFADAISALRKITDEFSGVIITDVRLPKLDGVEFFAHIREIDAELPVIFTTAHGDVSMAVDTLKNGAVDFLTKPYSIDRLARSASQAIDKRALLLENRSLRAKLAGQTDQIWTGPSPAMAKTARIVNEVAQTDVDLLLYGASGSGKSHIARLIHKLSPRRNRPFIVVDPGVFANEEANLLLYGRDPSAALSRSGMIERAQGGTLLLKNLEGIPAPDRIRLISLLDNRSYIAIGADRPHMVDIRVIGTVAKSNLADIPAAGQERCLIERLSGVTIKLPSLIERREDIAGLFRQFVNEYEQSLNKSAGQLTELEWQHLIGHGWPGNIRELKMFARNFVIGLTHLAQTTNEANNQKSLHDMVSNFEKTLLEDALQRFNGSVQDVQQFFAIPRKTLYDKFSKHNIKAKNFRGGF